MQDSDNDSDDSDDESEFEVAPSVAVPQSVIDISVPVINLEQSNEYGTPANPVLCLVLSRMQLSQSIMDRSSLPSPRRKALRHRIHTLSPRDEPQLQGSVLPRQHSSENHPCSLDYPPQNHTPSKLFVHFHIRRPHTHLHHRSV